MANFLAAVIKFFVIALVIFMLVQVNSIHLQKKKEAAPPAGPSSTDKLLMEIRDELKKS